MSIASELTNLRTNISNAYDAINNKGGTVPANKNTANLATAINSISGGGSAEVVNGVIANFKATSSTIDANTFVEFVNNITTGTNTLLASTSDSYQNAKAVALGADKVFVSHYGGNGYLYGIVCTVSGTTITAGTDTQLSTGIYSYQYASTVKLDTDKVFIAHQDRSGGNDYIYGMVCAIIGTTIVATANTQLTTVASSAPYASAVIVGSDKVFVNHKTGSYLYGVISNATDFVVQEATYGAAICGLTKTECTTSTAGEVWVLNA